MRKFKLTIYTSNWEQPFTAGYYKTRNACMARIHELRDNQARISDSTYKNFKYQMKEVTE